MEDENELTSLEESANPETVETDVQEHSEKSNDFLKRAAANLGGLTEKKLSKTQKWKNSKKAREEDFSSQIVTLLILVISSLNMPDEVKPNDEEIQAFSVPATKLLLRNVNVTGKLSQNALDAIGMVAALSAYYVRTSSAWRKVNEERRAKNESEKPASDDWKGGI